MNSNGNNGFGRRRPPEIKAPAGAAAGSPRSNGPGGTPGRDGVRALATVIHAPLVRQFRGILAGVGVVFFLVAVYVVAMKGFGKALDQHWQNNVGYPGLEDAYKRNARTDMALEQAHNDCKSRSDFVRLDARTTRALDGFDGLYSGEAALDKAAFYLSCLAGHKPERLCQEAHRAHLIAALKDYYRLMGRVREERMMATGGPFAAERMALMRPAGSAGRTAPPPPSAQTDERVVGALRTLLVEGYLSRRDLAPVLGSPGDLDVALRGVESRRKGCA